MEYTIPLLPLPQEIETRVVLKKTAKAHQSLAELKGLAQTIPNDAIIINTLALQEAKDSSAIENIITTHDELYQSDALKRHFATMAAKEVHSYAQALKHGYGQVRLHGILTNNYIIQIQGIIEENSAGFRKLPGTALKNEQTGETVYTPPQTHDQIVALMQNLEQFINDSESSDLDPLVKMAIIHHQFESIHPFYDGNGRTGRIINILYLVKEGLLTLPILYLSRYINQYKAEYYRLLQLTRQTQDWEPWLLFMLEGVAQTAQQTTQMIVNIKSQMQDVKHTMRSQLPKIYSQDLLNNLFNHPYTKIEFVMNELLLSKPTAIKYLDALIEVGILQKHKIGRETYYINQQLFETIMNVPKL